MQLNYEQILKLIEETRDFVLSSPTKYKHFLRTAATNYKYNFTEQLLIYIQNPNATACATETVWNRLNRQISSKSKPIYIVSNDKAVTTLYDITDTYGNNRVFLWDLHGDVTAFKQVLNVADETTDDIKSIINNEVDNSITNFPIVNDIEKLQLLRSAVGISVLSRCGFTPEKYYNIADLSFGVISTEDRAELVTLVQKTSETILRQIETSAKQLHREQIGSTSADIKKERKDEYEQSKSPAGRSKQVDRRANRGTNSPDDRGVRQTNTELDEAERQGKSSPTQAIEQVTGLSNRATDRVQEQRIRNSDENGTEREVQRSSESNRPDDIRRSDEQLQELRTGDNTSRVSITETQAAGDEPAACVISEEEIDAVLCKGSGVQNGKYRIYEQFIKGENSQNNIKMLRNEYGVGGSCPAVPGTNLDEMHDSKGILLKKGKISAPTAQINLNWSKVEKRIGKLIATNSYLSSAEQEHYIEYRKEQVRRKKINSIGTKIQEVVRKYNEFQLSIDNNNETLNNYVLSSCVSELLFDNPITYCRVKEGEPIFPLIREAMNTIITNGNNPCTDEAKNILHLLETSREIQQLETGKQEKAEKKMKYQFTVGDVVYIGTQKYQVLQIDEEKISLFDLANPLFSTDMQKSEFYEKLSENPLNENYLVEVESSILENRSPKTDYDDAFFVNADNETITWIYYNPDSNAGGQYVINTITFDELAETAKDSRDTNEFFDTLGEIANQTLADVGSVWFDETENQFLKTPDFKNCTEDTMKKLVDTVTKTPVYDRETEILFSVLSAININDMELNYDENGLVAKQNGLEWHGNEFYKYIVSTAFTYDKSNRPIGIPKEVLQDFIELSEHNGIEVKHSYPYDDYLRVKQENPDAVVMCKVGDFYELYGDFDTNIAHSVLGLETTIKSFESNTLPMCGFPLHIVTDYIQKLNSADYEVITIQHNENKLEEKKYAIEQTKDNYDDLIGEQLNIDDRDFLIESISRSGSVSMKDITFDNSTGFPIFRVEPVEFVLSIMEQQKKQAEQAQITNKVNYHITDNHLGVGIPKERFHRNYAAIKTLKKCQSENRLATPEEQNIMSKYVGWGGIPEAFDERAGSWKTEYTMLKDILTTEEYDAARESTLTAFYTPPVVINSIYKALENMGFENGNILEPSCGVGNFIGMLPDKMQKSNFIGVELDTISGNIAKQLYQSYNITVDGFERTNLSDNFFDVAIGNVPFNNIKLNDNRYNKYNFLIHDYFFAKSIDKVRPGGIIAFITSKGTMDKQNPKVRKYIAQRAELLGAIRLPNNTFKSAAGTEVTSDIIFLQKRDKIADIEPEWTKTGLDENGLAINQYFIDNPQQIIGEMKEISSRFGKETACVAKPDTDLATELSKAIQNISGVYEAYQPDLLDGDITDSEEIITIPADPDVRNYSYTIVGDDIYYRENSVMIKQNLSDKEAERVKGMVAIRDSVRQLIEFQTLNYEDSYIEASQKTLGNIYDNYVSKYGYIASRSNKSAFSKDDSYSLLLALEIYDDDNNYIGKAKIFNTRTIKPSVVVTSVDTASEALTLSLAEKATIDMEYMSELTGKTEKQLFNDLKGAIFLNPMYNETSGGQSKYLTADEYLSGNVREKLVVAQNSAKLYPEDYNINVEALAKVIPKDLTPNEISVRLGATWVPAEDINEFMYETFETPFYVRYGVSGISTSFSEYTSTWNISGKSKDMANVTAEKYGTERMTAYKILEETLNLKEVKVFDYIEDINGKRKAVLNEKETQLAQAKQEQIKQAFDNWVWKDPRRREKLCRIYNDKYNSIRAREYDGSHLNFYGINPEIKLRQHQVNAISHILYGGNTLLAHVVGAGKTFEMVAAAQESKRLGLCNKSLFVVPNHLTEQMATEYMQLYPSANILVAHKKDFEKKNRRRFCAQIATGDYDAVIIGHSQFEKIPLSIARQREFLQDQLDEVVKGIRELKWQRGEHFSVKELERTKKSINERLEKLNDQSRKDDFITFEELGVDRLFVDEAHYFKNLAVFTKMRNVGGITQTEAQKSSDLYMKCRYLDEITGGKGIVFATGTPVSNSMVELYTMQKYLQYDTLKKNHLENFDAWASTFGETTTEIALAPDGKSFQSKTRFSKFYNLPELMAMFKEVADIKTADMLNLDVPVAHRHNVVTKPSEYQKEMVDGLSKRADKVHNRQVASDVDNMLLIVNDGRKLALDQRMINDMLPKSETSKVVVCADNIFKIWHDYADTKATQLVFCDLSTPKSNDDFNIYDALKSELIERGIPEDDIAYVHSANSEEQKKKLFNKVKSGQIRVLIGSTQKMGAGTNVQAHLKAVHHLDCPWRPSDLEQREGRIIRQGNENSDVDIYNYVTEGTFDAYSYQTVENKQKFIGQIFTSKSPARSAEDVDEAAFNYAIIKSQCTGDPRIKEKLELDTAVTKLKLLKASYLNERYSLEDKINKDLPLRITAVDQKIKGYSSDIALRDKSTAKVDGFSPMILNGKEYTVKADAGKELIKICKNNMFIPNECIGKYRGFNLSMMFDSMSKELNLFIKGSLTHKAVMGKDEIGNITRIDNIIDGFETKLQHQNELKDNFEKQIISAKAQLEVPFQQEQELIDKQNRLNEINIALNVGGIKSASSDEILDEVKSEQAIEHSENEIEL